MKQERPGMMHLKNVTKTVDYYSDLLSSHTRSGHRVVRSSRCRPSSLGQRLPGPRCGEGGSGARRGWGCSAEPQRAAGGLALLSPLTSHPPPSGARPRRPGHAGVPPSAAEAKGWPVRRIWSRGHVSQRLWPMPGSHGSAGTTTPPRAPGLLGGKMDSQTETIF